MSVLEVKNVSICYMTGDFREIGLKEYVMRKLTGRYEVNEFWADRDVSFTLEKGDMLGIIGSNGAGKSTLLKVVSGIMEPSEGSVAREGSIAALLELASGFDGDLTVRENTYLRGAMLGYTREFMDKTYDEIIAFAELEDFQDRPFKQLSSGMKSRLAFSIACLVEPDILILDEVLSVGDGAFRKKSEDKMREVLNSGVTTILVSHSLDQVRKMCSKVLWLHKGEQIAFGENVEEICDQYQAFMSSGQKPENLPKRQAAGTSFSEGTADKNTVEMESECRELKPDPEEMRHMRRERWISAVRGNLIRAAVVAVLIALIEWFYFGFCNSDFAIPFVYSGDGIGLIPAVRSVMSGAGGLTGWPYMLDLSAYQAQTGMLSVIFFKLCSIFTDDPVIVVNLYKFAIPFFNVFVCFFVLRHFKVRDWLAFLAALTFGFCPYVQVRYLGHSSLGTVECIPIVIMMCVWCMEDPQFERIGKGWTHNKRNWIALFFSWMIANNGMVYYPFFSCFVLCVVAVYLLLRERKIGAIKAPVILIAQIAGWLALGFIPTVIGMLSGYGNVATSGATRVRGAGMKYMLRINSLLLSPNGYGIDWIRTRIVNYFKFSLQNDSFYNENSNAYMGVVAIVGFLMLIVNLFSSKREDEENELQRRLCLLSQITVAIILLSVSTGFGTLVNLFIPYIRCYNRMSPFLVCCGVFAVAFIVESVLHKYKGNIRGIVITAIVVVCFCYGLWEQQGIYGYLTVGGTEAIRTSYVNDKEFVNSIEDASGADAMVFQLPYMKSFESGPKRNIPGYDHTRGTVHSDTLRWSYGGMNGSENDLWYLAVSQLEPSLMIEELYIRGFSGIWLNLDGYEEEEGAELKASLCAAAHCAEPILCGDGHTIYIPLSNSLRYRIDPSSDEIREINYIAAPETISMILDDLGGDAASIQHLRSILQSNGTDGEAYSIAFPSGGTYQVHYKTPEERGEMRSIATLVEESDVSLENAGGYQIAYFPITIQENTLYKIELTLADNVDFSTAAGLTVDFYGGSAYDRTEQQASGFVWDGRYHYTFYFNSGEFGSDVLDCRARVFVWNLDTVIQVDSFSVTEMESLLAEN